MCYDPSPSVPRHKRAGFTLVELLIAMLLTSIVVSGTYLMFSSSSETFHHQELTAENHNNIRFAIELLKTDIGRAGYLSTPNAIDDPMICPKPSFPVPALMITQNQSITAPAVSYDELLVVGDMSSSPPLPVASIAPTIVTMQPDIPLAADEFEALFPPDRIIRVSNPEGMAQFAKVSSADGSNFSLSLSTSLTPATGEGACGFVPTTPENHEVNPVAAHLYRIELDPSEEEKTDLVRWQAELSGSSYTPIPGTRLVVAEYVVGMEFRALGVTGSSAPDKPDVAIEAPADLLDLNSSSSSPAVLTDVTTRPEGVRFVIYRIETRTRRAVPRRMVLPSSVITEASAERVYFELTDNRIAEVRTIQGKIDVPNLILRNLR